MPVLQGKQSQTDFHFRYPCQCLGTNGGQQNACVLFFFTVFAAQNLGESRLRSDRKRLRKGHVE